MRQGWLSWAKAESSSAGSYAVPSRGAGSADLWPGRILSVVALAYVVARAARIPITHDEAVTYLAHVSGTLTDVMAYRGFYPSNNHLLNTLLMKLSVALFGPAELALRLPAIFGFCLYLIGVDRIVGFLPRGKVRGLASLLLVAQPFLLEFFALARGYALGLGFLALGTESLWRHLSSQESRRFGLGVLRTTLLFALSVLSNLTFLPVFASVLVVLLAQGAFWRHRLRAIAAASLPSLVLLALLAGLPLLEMRAEGELYAGGDAGLWSDTILSLATACLYGRWPDNNLAPLLVALIALMVLFASVVVLIRSSRSPSRRVPEIPALAGTTAVLLGSLGLLVSQHHLLGINYPLPRMAIYLLPLLCMVALLVHAVQRAWWSSLFLKSFAAVLILHALTLANLPRQYSWRYDASTPEMLSYLEGRVAGGQALTRPLRLGIHWQLEPGISFYLHQRQIWWMAPVSRHGPDGIYDYYYLLAEDRALMEKYRFRILREFPESGTILAAPAS